MTVGLVEPKPVLVLAVGNQLLSDDGVGMVLLDELARGSWDARVEFVDGGTQGLARLGRISGRQSLIVLDAMALGSTPGTVYSVRSPSLRQLNPTHSTSAHESTAIELLRFAARLGELPPEIVLIGIEPESLATGMGLSTAVAAAVPEAVKQARIILEEAIYVPCNTR